ncbi:trypsin-like peptidase domain-containing protein [Gemmatimonadota bacterium]
MKKSAITRWTVLSVVLIVGVLAGLTLAGTWGKSASERSTDLALQALEAPVAIVPAALISVPESEPDEDVTIQQGGLPSLREAAARVRPGVVSVEVTAIRASGSRGFQMPESLPEEMREFFRFNTPQDNTPQEVRGEGSGFIFSPDGYIITNNHVVEGATDVEVTLPDKRSYKAEIVGTDELTDVAVIRIETDEPLHTVSLGNSDQLVIGDWVLAIGNPLTFDFTVTAGIVSALGRTLDVGPTEGRVRSGIQNFIQTDAVINRGNSGGPLVDLQGNVIGINTAIGSNSGFYEGYGFAIPINLARSVARDLIEFGRVKRSWLGLTFNIIDAPLARARSLPDNPPIGARVESITPGGSADEAGIRPNDIILEINGELIDNSGKLQTLVSTLKPGTEIEMVVYRGGSSRREGRRLTLDVTLQERPEDTSGPMVRSEDEPEPEQEPEEEKTPDRLGLVVSALDRDTAAEFGFDGRGVWVTLVERSGPTYDAFPGVLRGNVAIVELDGEAVRNVRDYERITAELESGSYVIMRIWLPGQPAGEEYLSLTVQVR